MYILLHSKSLPTHNYFQAEYIAWAAANKFESMLPGDTKRRKAIKADTDAQQTLDPHLRELPVKERVHPYTDLVFRQAAIEWLVSTDQVCFIILLNCNKACVDFA
jgi:hypothetical protein